MVKRKTLLLSLMLLPFLPMSAEDIDGIFVWVDGTSTCYKLESTPKVTYGENSVYLYLNGKTTPELTLPLVDGKNLKVTYGTYQETSIETVQASTSRVMKAGKYITGGKLVIVKDGKKYSINGTEIKN